MTSLLGHFPDKNNVFEDDQIVPDCSQTLKFSSPSSQGNWTTDLKRTNYISLSFSDERNFEFVDENELF
ncbi:hypothetical protein TNCV_3753911 [Trichonephila clavipes]|nr:hypothetical protein TNCV_3753911 [Trichonephila clavipes]